MGLWVRPIRSTFPLKIASGEPKLICKASNLLELQVRGGVDLSNENSKCAMIGCKSPVYRTLAIAPATVVELCAEHFKEEKGDLDDQNVPSPAIAQPHGPE